MPVCLHVLCVLHVLPPAITLTNPNLASPRVIQVSWQTAGLVLQAQHVGHWAQGNTAKKPSLEGILGPHSHTEVLFCCS